jgi:hypothetical protein
MAAQPVDYPVMAASPKYNGSGGGGGGGINFDQSPQRGTFFDLETTGDDGGVGINLAADNAIIQVGTTTAGQVSVYSAQAVSLSAGTSIELGSTTQIDIDAGTDVNIDGTGLGFFGVPAVGQQSAPSTLPQVIALLKAYGLSAP